MLKIPEKSSPKRYAQRYGTKSPLAAAKAKRAKQAAPTRGGTATNPYTGRIQSTEAPDVSIEKQAYVPKKTPEGIGITKPRDRTRAELVQIDQQQLRQPETQRFLRPEQTQQQRQVFYNQPIQRVRTREPTVWGAAPERRSLVDRGIGALQRADVFVSRKVVGRDYEPTLSKKGIPFTDIFKKSKKLKPLVEKYEPVAEKIGTVGESAAKSFLGYYQKKPVTAFATFGAGAGISAITAGVGAVPALTGTVSTVARTTGLSLGAAYGFDIKRRVKEAPTPEEKAGVFGESLAETSTFLGGLGAGRRAAQKVIPLLAETATLRYRQAKRTGEVRLGKLPLEVKRPTYKYVPLKKSGELVFGKQGEIVGRQTRLVPLSYTESAIQSAAAKYTAPRISVKPYKIPKKSISEGIGKGELTYYQITSPGKGITPKVPTSFKGRIKSRLKIRPKETITLKPRLGGFATQQLAPQLESIPKVKSVFGVGEYYVKQQPLKITKPVSEITAPKQVVKVSKGFVVSPTEKQTFTIESKVTPRLEQVQKVRVKAIPDVARLTIPKAGTVQIPKTATVQVQIPKRKTAAVLQQRPKPPVVKTETVLGLPATTRLKQPKPPKAPGIKIPPPRLFDLPERKRRTQRAVPPSPLKLSVPKASYSPTLWGTLLPKIQATKGLAQRAFSGVGIRPQVTLKKPNVKKKKKKKSKKTKRKRK